jgi:hypothetical protein
MSSLHNKSMKFIPVIDGGDIALRREYVDPLDVVYKLVDLSYDILLRHAGLFEAAPFIGQNLAVDCVYFDWFGDSAGKIWEQLLGQYLNFVPQGEKAEKFDGYWFNMNQA